MMSFIGSHPPQDPVSKIRTELFQVFRSLDIAIRDKFYADKIKITAAFDDGDLEAALYALQNIQTDTQAESDAKDQLLAIVSPLMPE